MIDERVGDVVEMRGHLADGFNKGASLRALQNAFLHERGDAAGAVCTETDALADSTAIRHHAEGLRARENEFDGMPRMFGGHGREQEMRVVALGAKAAADERSGHANLRRHLCAKTDLQTEAEHPVAHAEIEGFAKKDRVAVDELRGANAGKFDGLCLR